jgi:hypothetical protein
MVELNHFNEWIAMDHEWVGFAISRDIKVLYFMTFKTLKDDVYKVTIFDYNMTEVAKNCAQQEPAISMIGE